MRLSSGLLIVISLVALSGCAGMNEQACLVTDWRSVGFEDGIAGRSEGSIANYRQQCSKHGVAPDLEQYRAGHADGVETYCRAGNGFEVGRRGGRYQGVCPARLEGDFLSAYNEGRQLYELESAVRAVEGEIAARHRRLEKLNKDLGSTSIAIIADGTSAEDRAQLLLDTASMAAEQGKIANELEALEAERALRVADLQAYRQTIAYTF
jgi:hypothetical protein